VKPAAPAGDVPRHQDDGDAHDQAAERRLVKRQAVDDRLDLPLGRDPRIASLAIRPPTNQPTAPMSHIQRVVPLPRTTCAITPNISELAISGQPTSSSIR
jgi:hypothetical protein